MRPTPLRVAMRRALVAFTVTYFVLWACAPMASAPPPVPMAAGRADEIGIAASAATTVAPEGVSAPLGTLGWEGFAGALWYRHQWQRVDFGGSLYGGNVQGVGAGVLFRYRFVNEPNTVVALQLDGGFAYAAVGIPMAFALRDDLWFTVVPQGRLQFFDQARLGLGLNYVSPRGLSLGTELGTGYNNGGLGLDASLFLGVQL